MPDPAGFGSVASGMLGTQLDLQQVQLNDVRIQDARIGLIKDKVALSQELRMLQLMSGLKPGSAGAGSTPDGMAGLLNQMSLIQLESGMPDAAAKTAISASRLQENASKIDYRSYRMQNDRLTKFANVLGSVDDSPQGLAQALEMMSREDPGVARDPKFQKIAQMGWRPGLIGMLRGQVLSEKDAAEIKYRDAATRHADAAAILDKDRVALVKAQTRAADARTAALAKSGTTPVKAEQLRAITDQASRDYPSADPADIRVRSRPLAEEMLKMMREQHLTLSEAATRVYQQARSSGTFSGLRTPPTIRGAQPGVPLPLPGKPGDKVEDRVKQMRENQWYLVGGKPMLNMEGKLYSEDELAEMDKQVDAEDEAEATEE